MSHSKSLDVHNPLSGSLDRVSIKSAERFVQALTIAEILACRLEGDMLLYEVKWANSWMDETMLKDIFTGAASLIHTFSSLTYGDKGLTKQNGQMLHAPTDKQLPVNSSSERIQPIKCESLDNEVESHEIEVEADDATKGGTLYMCDICSVGFYSHQSLSSHKFSCHGEKHVAESPSSSMVVKNSNIGHMVTSNTNHMVTSSNIDDVVTTSSNEQFWEQPDDDDDADTDADIDDTKQFSSTSMVMALHSNSLLYECENCHMTFADEEYLSRHKVRCKNHTNSEFRCSVCFRGFTTKGSLELHVNAVHLKKKDFGCSICGKLFSRKHILKIHLATHYGERNFECTTCGKTFVQKSNYNRHIRIHESKNFGYKCRYCGQTFTQNKHVEKHVLAYHSTEKLEETT